MLGLPGGESVELREKDPRACRAVASIHFHHMAGREEWESSQGVMGNSPGWTSLVATFARPLKASL